VTPDKVLTFEAGSTQTVSGVLDLDGQAVGTEIVLKSDTPGTRFNLEVVAPTTVDHISVSDSEVVGGSGNNIFARWSIGADPSYNNDNGEYGPLSPPNWIFGVTLSGHVRRAGSYTHDVVLVVNGAIVDTTVTSGWQQTFSFSNVSFSDGDRILLFLDDTVYNFKANAIGIVQDYMADIAGVTMENSHMMIGDADSNIGTSFTNADLAAGYYNDSDVMYSLSGGDIIFEEDSVLQVPVGMTYSPGSDITVGGDLEILGAFEPGTHTVTFNDSDTDNIVLMSGSEFYDLVFNNAAGEWQFTDDVVVNKDMLMTAGSLKTWRDVVVKGDVIGDGSIYQGAGEFRVEGTGDFGGDADWTFYDLTFGDGSSSEATAKTGDNMVTALNRLTIAAGHELLAGDDLWNLTWSAGYLNNIEKVASGTYHTLALTDLGTVYAWGSGWNGRLGIGTETESWTPVQVHTGAQGDPSGFLQDIVQVEAGPNQSFAIASDGTAYAWGGNYEGVLGDGTTTERLTPIRIHAGTQPSSSGFLENVVFIYAGFYNSAAVISDGSAYTWGNNQFGQLGDGTTTNSHTPVRVIAGDQSTPSGFIENAVEIGMADAASLVLISDGTVFAWGTNWTGQFGNGGFSWAPQLSPVQTHTGAQGDPSGFLQNIDHLAVSDAGHVLALTETGTVYAWGFNRDGQVGDNSQFTRSLPVRVVTGEQGAPSGYLENIVQVSAGTLFSTARASDGTIYTWGDNQSGELGDGTNVLKPYPVRAHDGMQDTASGFLEDIVYINAGSGTPVAVTSSGTTYSWGSNYTGDLGDNSEVYRNTPVRVLAGESTANDGAPAHIPFVVDGTFTYETSRFRYSGYYDSNTTIVTSTTYYDLEFDNAAETYLINGPVTVMNDLDLISGTVQQEGDLSIGNDYTQAGGTFIAPDPLSDSFSVGGSFAIPDTAGAFDRYTGAGTGADPYVVRDVYDLQAMKGYLSSDFIVASNIDASSTSGWNAGGGFDPVGDNINPFTGTFDGKGYTVLDLFIDIPLVSYVGLFGYTDPGTVLANVNLDNADVTGRYYVGSLVGVNEGDISWSSSTNVTVVGRSVAGGLVGRHEAGSITDSNTSGDVSAIYYIGGFVGRNFAYIADCFSHANGSSSVNNEIGSFVGYNAGTITYRGCIRSELARWVRGKKRSRGDNNHLLCHGNRDQQVGRKRRWFLFRWFRRRKLRCYFELLCAWRRFGGRLSRWRICRKKQWRHYNQRIFYRISRRRSRALGTFCRRTYRRKHRYSYIELLGH